MTCICQYFVTARSRRNALTYNDNYAEAQSTDEINNLCQDKKNNFLNSCEVSATDLASSKAEIWLLKKNLNDAHISIENLENLVKTIIGKQNEMLSEMYDIKRQNIELQNECRMQREYQTMERNSLMRELYDIKSILGGRSKLLEETVQKNSELTNALQDANEKIYVMGMKFLKLKSTKSKNSSDRSSDRSSNSSEKSNSSSLSKKSN